ncbi:hypothetical protein Esti_005076 [Eimeria stiedai]
MGRALSLTDIDFDLIEKCKEPKTLRRILLLLQQDGGHYVALMKAAEERLLQLTGRSSTGNTVSEADRQQVAQDLLAWEQTMLQQQQQQQQSEGPPELETIEEQQCVAQTTRSKPTEHAPPSSSSSSSSSSTSSSSSSTSSSSSSTSTSSSSSGEVPVEEAVKESENEDTNAAGPVAAAATVAAEAANAKSSKPRCSNNTAAAAAGSSSNAVQIPIVVLEDSGDESDGYTITSAPYTFAAADIASLLLLLHLVDRQLEQLLLEVALRPNTRRRETRHLELAFGCCLPKLAAVAAAPVAAVLLAVACDGSCWCAFRWRALGSLVGLAASPPKEAS